MLTLNAEKRDSSQDNNKLRMAGRLPAVFYGKKVESVSVAVPMVEFKKIWAEAGESTVITLKTPNGDLDALIYEVDIDPVKSEPRHADFYIIDKDQKIVVSVPLRFVGVSPAVKELGATLLKVMHEIEIKVLPKDLPNHIDVDISSLSTLDSQIVIKDLKIPESATPTDSVEEVIAAVSVQREEEESSASADISSVEVEKKGKKEEAEGEATK